MALTESIFEGLDIKGLATLLEKYVDPNNSEESAKLSEEQFNELLTKFAKINQDAPEQMEMISDQIANIQNLMRSNPKYRNFQTLGEIAEGIEGGVELFNTMSNIATAKRQIEDAREAGDALVEPEIPPMSPKSQELAEATETARRRRMGPIKEIDPILQRNLDLLQGDLGVARSAAGGQAGTYGALGQTAINRARRSNLEAIPMTEQIRRQQEAEYNQLVRSGLNEEALRDSQRMSRYELAQDKYLTEAQAIGNLGAVGQENLAMQRADLANVLPSSFRPLSSALINNLRFNQGSGVQSTPPAAPVLNTRNNYSALGNLNPKYDVMNNNLDQSLSNIFLS